MPREKSAATGFFDVFEEKDQKKPTMSLAREEVRGRREGAEITSQSGAHQVVWALRTERRFLSFHSKFFEPFKTSAKNLTMFLGFVKGAQGEVCGHRFLWFFQGKS